MYARAEVALFAIFFKRVKPLRTKIRLKSYVSSTRVKTATWLAQHKGTVSALRCSLAGAWLLSLFQVL
jgi:hypothetical protein